MAKFPTEFNDTIVGDGTDNIIDALAGNDFINGVGGNDTLIGNSGNDTMIGGAGLDILRGGKGSDTVSYYDYGDRVSVNLAEGIGYQFSIGEEFDADTLIGIENVTGSAFSDVITGNNASNTLDGLDGFDVIAGGGGRDRILGGLGFDSLSGGAGNDTLLGGEDGDSLRGDDGDDALNGGAGNDTLYGGAGADKMDGGTGTDTVNYMSSVTGVTIDLGANTASGGDAAGDLLNGIENAWGSGTAANVINGSTQVNTLNGGNGNDTLRGFGGDDLLAGSGGNDGLSGGSGADLLLGGTGRDTLTGGAGADKFSYRDPSGSLPAERDTITDFELGIDKVFFDFDEDDEWPPLNFIGTADFLKNAPGQVRYFFQNGNTFLEVEFTGDVTADMSIRLLGEIALTDADIL